MPSAVCTLEPRSTLANEPIARRVVVPVAVIISVYYKRTCPPERSCCDRAGSTDRTATIPAAAVAGLKMPGQRLKHMPVAQKDRRRSRGRRAKEYDVDDCDLPEERSDTIWPVL